MKNMKKLFFAVLVFGFVCTFLYMTVQHTSQPTQQSDNSIQQNDAQPNEEDSGISLTVKQIPDSPWVRILEQAYLGEMVKMNGLEAPPKFENEEDPKFKSILLKDILVEIRDSC